MKVECLSVDKACRAELLYCRFIALMASINIFSVYSPLQCGFAGYPINKSLLLEFESVPVFGQ